MSFDWIEFFKLAVQLDQHATQLCSQEAALRSATSRAYYAAYHCARLWICQRERGFCPDDHQKVINYFKGLGKQSAKCKKVAQELYRLKKHRQKADYEPKLPRSATAHSDQAIEMAKSILVDLQSLREV